MLLDYIIPGRRQEQEDTQMRVHVAIEYNAPHWVLMVRAPGQLEFTALRHATMRIAVYDEYGLVKSRFAPILHFDTHSEAAQHVQKTMPDAVIVKRDQRQPGYFRSLLSA